MSQVVAGIRCTVSQVVAGIRDVVSQVVRLGYSVTARFLLSEAGEGDHLLLISPCSMTCLSSKYRSSGSTVHHSVIFFF